MLLSNTEKIVKNIWEKILEINVNDSNLNFFSLGGNSIQAFEIIATLNELFKIELSISDFFDTLTVTELSKLISSKIL